MWNKFIQVELNSFVVYAVGDWETTVVFKNI